MVWLQNVLPSVADAEPGEAVSIGWAFFYFFCLLCGHYSNEVTGPPSKVITDQTVKVCAYNFSESGFLQAKQAIIELTLRTI